MFILQLIKRCNKMTKEVKEEKPNGLVIKNEHNEFELALRFLGNELIAIKMAATNFSGRLIVWSILLLIFSFLVLEVFGLSAMFGYGIE